MVYAATGNVYEGYFQDDLRHGHGVYYDVSTKSRYDGQWARGRRHGQGTLYFADGSSATGEWRSGKPNQLIYTLPQNSPWNDPDN